MLSPLAYMGATNLGPPSVICTFDKSIPTLMVVPTFFGNRIDICLNLLHQIWPHLKIHWCWRNVEFAKRLLTNSSSL